MVRHWAKTFGLRPGLTQTTCVDLLLMLAGPANYRELVVEDRWRLDDYRAWLHGQVLALLAPQPAARAAPARSAGGAGKTRVAR
jgi:hypothetical protein